MRSIMALMMLVMSLLGGTNSTAAQEICALVYDVGTNKSLYQSGDCDRRVTPASTFKFPLAIMGFETGILKSPTAPKWPFKSGYPAWGGANWQKDTHPKSWLKHSVVWYSQLIAKEMGVQKLTQMAQSFGYGNADFSGDPGKNNGLERAWIASSLQISPHEQLVFLTKFVRRELPLAPATYLNAKNAMPTLSFEDWVVYGKTGMAYPRLQNGQLDREHPYGWYVGWAEKGDKIIVFVQLRQDPHKIAGSASSRAKETIIARLKALLL